MLAQDPAMYHGVILAGGGGTRLWPASRASRPKQLLPLGKRRGQSLLSATRQRLQPACDRIVVVTAASQAELLRADMPDLAEEELIAEPARRNTAAALGLAAVHLAARDPAAILGAVPADHHVRDDARFAEVARAAFAAAEATGAVVTVGVVPTRAETGFGYLELGASRPDGTREVRRFVEKPDRETAERFFASGDYLWNAGMFFFPAAWLLDELRTHLPETHEAMEAIAAALSERGPRAAAEEAERLYPELPSISIDHGIMERTSGVLTVPGDFGWDDIGSWEAIAAMRDADDSGNVTEGRVVTRDARGNILMSDDDCLLAVLGADDLVVVKSGDAILVVPRSRVQEVRELVAAIEEEKLGRYL